MFVVSTAYWYVFQGQTPVKHLLTQSQLRWLGHVVLMPSNRLLYGELCLGQRPANCRKKRFMCHVRTALVKCSIKTSELETSANDRAAWKAVCTEGLSSSWMTASLSLRSILQSVTWLQQNQRLVHDVPTAVEYVRRSSDIGVIFGASRPAYTSSSESAAVESVPVYLTAWETRHQNHDLLCVKCDVGH